MFFSLVRRNSRRNRKENGIFFLSLIVSIIAFYIILSLEQQDVIRFLRTMESDAVNRLLHLIPVLYGFSLFIIFFLIYFASKYQMERRSHEFGMYFMMGMRKGRLALLLMLEDLWGSFLSLLVGIPAAVFLSELISLITAKLVGLGILGHQSSFSGKALFLTVIGFLAVKFAAFFVLSKKTAKTEISRLLSDTQETQRKELKKQVSYAQFFLGILLLAFAYGLAIKKAAWEFQGTMGISVLLGVIGTVLLFLGLRSALRFLMKKNSKKNRLGTFTFRQLQESIICRPVSLAVASLMILLAVCCFGYGVSVGVSSKNQETHVLDYTFQGDEKTIRKQLDRPEISDHIQQLFEIRMASFFTMDGRHKLDWRSFLETLSQQEHTQRQEIILHNLAQDSSPYVISLSGYNQILRAAGKEEISLKENQTAFYCGPHFIEAETAGILRNVLQHNIRIKLDDFELEMIPEVSSSNLVVDRAITISYGLIVTDRMFDRLFPDQTYVTSYWNAVLKQSTIERAGLMQAISEVNQLLDKTGLEYESYLQNLGRQLFYTVAASYTTLYIAIIFLIIANTVLAVQFLMQQQKNKKRYRTLINLGSGYGMLCQSARKEIQWYFGLPVGVAAVSSIFGVKALFAGMLPPDAQGQASALFSIALAIILVLCVVECIYITAVIRLSDRHILEMMKVSREE